MDKLFITVLNMSITAGWLILAVFVLRLLLKRAPKSFSVFLWCLVGIRLLVPFSVESIFSLLPSKETVSPEIIYSKVPAINSGSNTFDQVVNPVLKEAFAPNIGDSVNPLQIVTFVASVIWLVGSGAMLLYTTVTYMKLRERMKEAVRFRDNIFQSEKVESPFVLGILNPRIYIPYTLEGEALECVIAHEEMHIKRRDYILKPLGFMLLIVYWFQPLVWIAYNLFCKDIELACDERVMRRLGSGKKKVYSETLLEYSVTNRMFAACPIAFGETDIKNRIRNILNYKKPAVWVLLFAVCLCVVFVACFMTNPKEDKAAEALKKENENKAAEVLKKEHEKLTQEKESAEKVALQSPPVMNLSDPFSSILAYFSVGAGTYTWNYSLESDWQYPQGGLITGASAEGAAPQDAVKGQEWLSLANHMYDKIGHVPYEVNFSVMPDKVILKEYDLLDLGDMDAEILSETEYEEILYFELKPRRIYEVIATWNERSFEENGFYGTAHYAFATDDMMVESKEETNVENLKTITVTAQIKEILADRKNQILINHLQTDDDTESVPGVALVKVSKEICAIENLEGGDTIKLTMQDTGKDTEGESIGNYPIYEAIQLRIHP